MGKAGIIGPGYLGVSPNINASRCVNFYPVLNTEDSKSISALVGTPGLDLFADTGSGPIRGMHVFNGLIYFVTGNKLHSINNAGIVSAQLGNDLGNANGRVVMVDNGLTPTGGDELAIADGEYIYIYDVGTGTMTTLSKTSRTVAFVNGYFAADLGGMGFGFSDLYDGVTWSALNESTADGAADDLLAVYNNHGELWLFGEYTTEIWYLTGSASPLFSRISGGVLDYGCAARYSVAKGNNTLFWLATQKNNNAGEFVGVAMASGYSVQVISTEPINQQISKYSVIGDAFGYCYTDGGHTFYVLTFPSADATWVYDVSTNLWHERSSYKGSPYAIGRHIGNCYAYYIGKHYIGDYASGKIYRMSADYLTDDGSPIASVRISDNLNDKFDLNNIFVNKLQIDAEIGTGGIVSTSALAAYAGTTISTGTGEPYDLEYDGTNLWVTAKTNLLKINPANNQVISTLAVGTSLAGVKYALGYIWAADNGSNVIYKINPTDNTLVSTITTGVAGSHPAYITEYEGYIWVSNNDNYTVVKIDPATESIVLTVAEANAPLRFAIIGGYIWITTNSGRITKIDPTSGAVVYVSGMSSPSGIISDGRALWVSDYGNGNIYKVDPINNAIIETIATGSNSLSGVYFDGYYVLVSNYAYPNAEDGSCVFVIDPNTNAMAKTLTSTLTGSNPNQSVLINNVLYVANYNSGKTVTTINYSRPVCEEKEPRAMLSWSDDGGHTWSNNHEAYMGKSGEYSKRLIWYRLGKSRGRIFRLSISDAVKKVLLSAHIQAVQGNH